MPGEIERWHDFYVLVGTAGATLVALLFVAVSLGAGFLTEARAGATRAFFTSVVIHFSEVFFVSALALMPSHEAVVPLAIGICAAAGLGVSAYAAVQIVRNGWTTFITDHFAYGLMPCIAYAAMLAAAVTMLRHWPWSLELLAAAVLLLFGFNIRNAWDLMLSMVRRRVEPPQP